MSLNADDADWLYTGLEVLTLGPGENRRFRFEHDEVVVLPLSGACRLESPDLSCDLERKSSIWGGLADRAYLPPDASFQLVSEHQAEVAICLARAKTGGNPAYLRSADTEVEVRGAGQASRQINGLWPADLAGPERIIVVEVLTPEGNWSSYPPHKHDEFTEGEVPLEEIYYFRVAGGGFGFHRTYTTDHEIDESVTVCDGDVFLVHRGYHGPCVAAPGYNMYYLNVMAGPERAWEISTDPAHEWIWDTWADLPPDPRLPWPRPD